MACSHSATAPDTLPDPTVLVTNQAPDSGLYFSWWDQSGKVSETRLAPMTTQCLKFTPPADSVRFRTWIGDSTSGHAFFEQWSSWFLPSAPGGGWKRSPAFWTATALVLPASYYHYGIALQPVAIPPC
jgi:hypothetical protein